MEFAFYFGLLGVLGLTVFFSVFFIVRLFRLRKNLKSAQTEFSLNDIEAVSIQVKKKKILSELNDIDTDFQTKIKAIERHLKAL